MSKSQDLNPGPLAPETEHYTPVCWRLPSSPPSSREYKYLMKSVSSELPAPKPTFVARGQSCSVQGETPILRQGNGAKRIREWFSGKPGLRVTFCPRGGAKSHKAQCKVYLFIGPGGEGGGPPARFSESNQLQGTLPFLLIGGRAEAGMRLGPKWKQKLASPGYVPASLEKKKMNSAQRDRVNHEEQNTRSPAWHLPEPSDLV